MSLEVTFHQALFGYRAGHNLLASSCPLSAESRRLLAELTDASGPWPASGFDCVFTGVPLPDASFYAFFCTWPAPEMTRPGCVWSHVLLIELADLAGLVDLSELRDIFKRPTKDSESSISQPLSVACKNERATPVPSELKKDAMHFLESLYATPKEPFVKESPDGETYTGLVFAIWSQQWPRLRRNFRFSTGSFTDRSRSGVKFDLQIIPASNYRAWQRSETRSKPKVSNEMSEQVHSEMQWVNSATLDLIAPDMDGFRAFLHTYGVDVNNPRSAYAALATAYQKLILSPIDNWTEQLRSVGKFFPEASEALRLKEWLVAPQETIALKQNLERAWSTTSFILSAREARAYSSVSFDHAGLAPLLWDEKRNETLSLLDQVARQPENPSTLAFVVAVANAIRPFDLRSICEAYPELILFFFRHRHSLAFETETWLLPEHIQWRIFETLDELPLSCEDWCKTMAAMFLTATSVAVRSAVEKAGDRAIEGAFQWLDNKIAQEYLPSQIWREALAEHASKRLRDDFHLSPSHLALCAWLVPPKIVRQILNASRSDVQQLTEQPLDTLPSPLRVPTAFLLVTLGLRTEGPQGIRMLRKGFFQVHDALAAGDYFSDSWSLLSSELPRSPMWKEWDRCEKLRRAVRNRLLNPGERKSLFETAFGPKHRDLVKKILEADNDDNEFID